MRQFNNPENMGSIICPPQEKKNRGNKFVYSTEFQAMLDGLDEEDERSQGTERKRRLGFEQVKALERIFEVDNKLESERKVKIAEELGLQPRQVAIWFQNRRARRKTKQLEKDYGLLKSNYEALKLNYGNLAKERESLIAEAVVDDPLSTGKLEELRAKIGEENSDCNQSVREEAQTLESENNVSEQSCGKLEVTNLDYELGNHGNSLGYVGFEDGLSDNNCSGVFNGDSSLNPHLLRSSISRYDGSMDSSWMNNCFQFDSRAFPGLPPKVYPDQLVKMEEQGWFRSEDSSSYVFSVDQAPPLHWFRS